MREAARGRIQGLLERIWELDGEIHGLVHDLRPHEIAYYSAGDWAEGLAAGVIAAEVDGRGEYGPCPEWAFARLHTAVDSYLDRDERTEKRMLAAMDRVGAAGHRLREAQEAAAAVVH